MLSRQLKPHCGVRQSDVLSGKFASKVLAGVMSHSEVFIGLMERQVSSAGDFIFFLRKKKKSGFGSE